MNRNLKKRQSMILGAIVAFMMIGVGLFTGCTSNNTNNNTNIKVSYPVLSSIDGAVLDNAYEDYESLKQNLSYMEAREQLLEKLNNETGVEKAELGLDNYTIFITYSDGDVAAVDTFELDEAPQQEGIGFSPYAYGRSSDDDYLAEHTITFDGFSKEYDDVSEYDYGALHRISYSADEGSPKQKTTIGSKKILILGPTYYETAYYDSPTNLVDDTVNLFKKNGWSDKDITLKLVKKSPDDSYECMELTPQDFYDYRDYGIILFIGHGTSHMWDDLNESRLFLQFCFLNNASFVENPEFQEWKNQTKLLISRRYSIGKGKSSEYIYETLISADLLRQKINATLPSSYVYLSSCFGWYFSQLFLDKGAQVVLSWPCTVKAKYADSNLKNMVKLLLEKDYSLSDAYADSSIIKAYNENNSVADYDDDIMNEVNPLLILNNYRYQFMVHPNPLIDDAADAFYFPKWVHLKVTGIPSGTKYITSSLYDSSDTLLGQATDTVSPSDSQIECKNLQNILAASSEEVTVTIKAYNSGGEELASRQSTVQLETRGYPLQIALTESGGLTIEFTNQKNGQLDVHRSLNELWSLDLKAKLQNPPNGDILYVWDNLGDSSLGGFGMNMLQHLETDDYDTSFYSSGNGTDGRKIPITCTAYLVKEDGGRELLASGSAEIEVYHPTQIYEICGPDSTKAPKFGSDSTWDFIHVDHRMLYGNQFYARKGDQLQVICSHAGKMYEGFDYDIYIRVGKTSEPPAATQLIVSESEIVDGLNKIVTIDI
jgi:hypothetical protein